MGRGPCKREPRRRILWRRHVAVDSPDTRRHLAGTDAPHAALVRPRRRTLGTFFWNRLAWALPACKQSQTYRLVLRHAFFFFVFSICFLPLFCLHMVSQYSFEVSPAAQPSDVLLLLLFFSFLPKKRKGEPVQGSYYRWRRDLCRTQPHPQRQHFRTGANSSDHHHGRRSQVGRSLASLG